MARCYENNFICNPGCNENNFIYKPIKTKKCSRCGNLLENPSFEAGLTGWVTNNVSAATEKPFEGTAIARMGQTAPSMFQDVLLNKNCRKPLLLSFEILPSVVQPEVHVGNLIVEVLWLNDGGEIIGTGLRTLIPEERTSITQNRLTFVEITDLPPSDAATARLQFSKGSREIDNSENLLDIDQVILVPIDSINFVKNSGFQLALTNWNTTNATAQFTNVYEGTGTAKLDDNGIIFQNIPINQLPRNSKFLLSFAVIGSVDAGSLRAQVIWLDKFGSPVGTGLDLLITGAVLQDQSNYTTYVDITNEAPRNAVTAQIKFINDSSDVFQIDKVIFARVMSTNLLQNPSFENNLTLSPWIGERANVVQTDESYEGNRLIRIDANGGFVSQEVPVEATHCYLLNFGYEPNISLNSGNLLAEVYWLNRDGQEIGIGLSIIIGPNAARIQGRWLTYLGVTEGAPENAVRARVQFSRTIGINTVDIDKVVFARLV